MKQDSVKVAVQMLLVVGIGVYLGLSVMDQTAADLGQYLQDSEEWCHQRGGELHNSMVIGPHGGLHCEFSNGTAVHMSNVDAVSETAAD